MNEKTSKIIEAAKSALGYPYVFGMWGRECSTENRRNYASYNPSHKSWIYSHCPVLSGKQKTCEGCTHEDTLAFDCRGFTYWCLSKAGIKITGSGCTEQYNTKANWAQRGSIDEMPNLPCIVFMYYKNRYQHTGVHIGNGVIIHCAYDDNGVQYGSVTSDARWSHYAIPAGLYTAAEIAAAKIYDPDAPVEPEQPEEPEQPAEQPTEQPVDPAEDTATYRYILPSLTRTQADALVLLLGGSAEKEA